MNSGYSISQVQLVFRAKFDRGNIGMQFQPAEPLDDTASQYHEPPTISSPHQKHNQSGILSTHFLALTTSDIKLFRLPIGLFELLRPY